MHARRTAIALAATATAAMAAVAVGVVARRRASAPSPQVRTGTFPNGVEYAALGSGPRTVLFLPGGPGTVPFAGIWARMGSGMLKPLAGAGFTVWRLSRRRNMPPGHTVVDMTPRGRTANPRKHRRLAPTTPSKHVVHEEQTLLGLVRLAQP